MKACKREMQYYCVLHVLRMMMLEVELYTSLGDGK